MLAWGPYWRDLLARIEADRHRTGLDQWELHVQCRVLARSGSQRLCFASYGIPADLQRHVGLTPLPGEDDATQHAERALGDHLRALLGARVAVIPAWTYRHLKSNDEQPLASSI